MVAPFTIQGVWRAQLGCWRPQGATALWANRLDRLQGEVMAPPPSRQITTGPQRAQDPGSVGRQDAHHRRDEKKDQRGARSPGNAPRSRTRADENARVGGIEPEENDAGRELEDTIDFGVRQRSHGSRKESVVAVEGGKAVMYVADSITPRCLATCD